MDELRQLQERIEQLEERVRVLEAERTARPKYPEPAVKLEPNARRKEPRPPAPKRSREDLEQEIGRVWLPRLAALFVVIGAVFLFATASVNGWIGPMVRIGLGVVFGIGLIGVGAWQLPRARRLAIALVASGGAVALLAWYAGSALFGLYPSWFAFLMGLIVVIIWSTLAYRYASEFLLLLASFSALLLPYLSASDGNVLLFVAYSAIVVIAMTGLARNAGSPFVFGLTGLFASFSFSVMYGLYNETDLFGNRLTAWPILLGLLLVWSIQYVLLLKKPFPPENVETLNKRGLKMSWFAWLAPTFVFVALLMLSVDEEPGRHLLLAVPLIAYALTWQGHRFASVFGHVALIAWVSELELDVVYADQWLLFLQVLLVGAFYFVPWARMHRQVLYVSIPSVLLSFAAIDLRAMSLIESQPFWVGMASLLLLSGFGVYAAFSHTVEAEWETASHRVRLAAYGVIAFSVMVTYTIFVTILPFYEGLDFTGRSTAISIAYIVFALVLVAVGMFTAKRWRTFGLILLVLSATKLLLFDLTNLSLVQRALVFIGYGVVAFIVSRSYFERKRNKKKGNTKDE